MRQPPRSRYDSSQPRENFQLKHVFASIKALPHIALMQSYYTQTLTIDQHVKEIRLFNLGDFFLGRFKRERGKVVRGDQTNLAAACHQ